MTIGEIVREMMIGEETKEIMNHTRRKRIGREVEVIAIIKNIENDQERRREDKDLAKNNQKSTKAKENTQGIVDHLQRNLIEKNNENQVSKVIPVEWYHPVKTDPDNLKLFVSRKLLSVDRC